MNQLTISVRNIVKSYFLRISILLLCLASTTVKAVTNTATAVGGGTWATATWSAGHIPLVTEDVVINSAVPLTINTAAVCNSLTLGSATSTATTLTLGAGGSLAVTGNVIFNPFNENKAFIIDVASRTMTIGGTVLFPTANTSTLEVSSGSITVTGAVTVGADGKIALIGGGTFTINGLVTLSGGTITNTGTAGTYYFAAGLSYSSGTFTSKANEVIEFGSTLNCSLAAGLTFNAKSTEKFLANTTITPTDAITFGNFTINSGVAVTLAGAITVAGSWVNNATATAVSGAYNITFSGAAKTVTGSTTFPSGIIIANAATITLEAGTFIASSLTLNSGAKATSLTQVSGANLTVTNATINQPTKAVTINWAINAGTATVSGTLTFPGVTGTAAYVAKTTVTTGTFSVAAISFANNSVPADEEINLSSTGTITVTNALTFTYGEFLLSGAGTIIFNNLLTQNGGTIVNSGAAGTYNFKSGLNISSGTFTSMSAENIDFGNNFTCSLAGGLVLNVKSNSFFTGNSTVTPTTAITFGNLTINNTFTATLAGSINVAGNWTDNGTFTPSTNGVTFDGAGTTQIINSAETFYNLTSNNVAGKIQLDANVMVTNQLTMTAANFNLNTNTLTLGNNAAASLTYTSGIIYGGTFKRWWPVAAITSNSGSYYGLFPMGITTSYRPLTVNSTVNPTTAGYVSVVHNNAATTTVVAYTDNEGTAIQRISNENTTVTTSGGLAGGTYTIAVRFGGFDSIAASSINDYRLETYTGSVMGSAGATVAATNWIVSPTLSRSGLSLAQLAQEFVAGTKNLTNTPILALCYSIANGNWSTAGTWSYTSGGASCACTPATTGYAIVENNYTVTLTAGAQIGDLVIQTGGDLTGASSLTVSDAVTITGAGYISTTGAVTVTNAMTITGTGASTLGAATTISGALSIGNGTSLTMNGTFPISLGNNVTVSGTLGVGTGTTSMTGANAVLDGTGNITGTGTFQASSSISIASTANITIAPTFNISTGQTVTNNGTATLSGNLTGGAGSIWSMQSGSVFNIGGSVFSTGGTLDPSTCACANTVNYDGAGAQTIVTPGGSGSDYSTLECSNAGTKSLSGNIVVNNALTITGSAIVNEGTNTITDNGALGSGVQAALNMSGANPELIMQRGASGIYPELTGLYTLTSGGIYINQTSGTASVSSNEEAASGYYDLYLTGSSNYDLSGGGGGLTIQDNLNVQNSSAITTIAGALSVGNAINYTSTGSTTMDDDITTGNYTQSIGTLNDGGNNIYINGASGGWTNNGGTFTATGTITFEGTAAQTIGGTAGTSFATVTINNSSGVTLSQPVTVTSSLGWGTSGGVIFTSGSSLLTIGTAAVTATISAGNSTSYVDGPIAIFGPNEVTFPVGNAGTYAELAIQGSAGAIDNGVLSTEFECQYSLSASPNYRTTADMDASGNAGCVTHPGENYCEGIDHTSGIEYWTLSLLSSNSPSEKCFVTLTSNNPGQSDITSMTDLCVAHFDGVTGLWENMGPDASGSVGGTVSVTSAQEFIDFSPITFGSKHGTNPLPIQLASFTANCDNYSASLKWTTATETNNDHFTVERTQDGVNFETVAIVKGAGNSTTPREYSAIDQDPLQGTSYYRLSQTDLDGNTTHLNTIVYTPCENENTINSFVSNNLIKVEINNAAASGGNYTFVLYNTLGQEVYSKNVNASEGLNLYTINSQNFTNGIYIIRIMGSNSVYTHKILLGQ